MKKKLPIGISTLCKMIRDGYVYVDKTRYVYEMASSGVYYFLSRPRRFGKTLFVDTLKEAFEGNRELFRGLWLYDHWDWDKKYPVIHISFAEGQMANRGELDTWIIEQLKKNQRRLAVPLEPSTFIPLYFSQLIEAAHATHGQPAVILIDEYDKPILDNIATPEIAAEMREGLKNLYSVIKGQDAHIQFVFLTGVSKFSKVSIFSGLNNLRDITIDEQYSSICGYTESELTEHFKEHLAGHEREMIRQWYNGYSWTGEERVYNPFSIINYLQTKKIRNYWFETGTPSFLIELFKKKRYYIPQLENLEVGESILGSFDVDFIEPENILFQSGYLTIADAIMKGSRWVYRLTYPNLEVRQSLSDYILRAYHHSAIEKERAQNRLYDCLMAKDISGIVAIMRAHFASIPHDWYRKNHIDQYEGYYASVFYAYFASIGVDVRVEDPTHYGQVDMAVLLPEVVYVFEFKAIDGEEATGEALAQLQAKGYAAKYRGTGRQVQLVGLEFSKTKRQIVGVAVEQ
ncbi:ATP-binding protein [Thermochromatium tepidum]|uniref:AAA family ATPase n=1 Tax=Thermochromatium tepidum ATCC 43061 TaxID=316276 RepID=A0A6I6EID3_THETI|nr:ATP-binding protein [Thermochromatium tepidum]QGU32977.1 AAA family ATPase [Thermochromatium tepidum ATCC 43061]